MSKTIISNYNISDVTSSMRRMLTEASHDADLRDLSISIVRDNPASDIYDWVKSNVQYISDPLDIELIQHPSRMIQDFRAGKKLSGDCDDISLLTAAMLQSVGLKSRIALIDTKGQGLDHAVAQAWSDKLNDWLFIDPSTDRLPFGWSESHKSIVVI